MCIDLGFCTYVTRRWRSSRTIWLSTRIQILRMSYSFYKYDYRVITDIGIPMIVYTLIFSDERVVHVCDMQTDEVDRQNVYDQYTFMGSTWMTAMLIQHKTELERVSMHVSPNWFTVLLLWDIAPFKTNINAALPPNSHFAQDLLFLHNIYCSGNSPKYVFVFSDYRGLQTWGDSGRVHRTVTVRLQDTVSHKSILNRYVSIYLLLFIIYLLFIYLFITSFALYNNYLYFLSIPYLHIFYMRYSFTPGKGV